METPDPEKLRKADQVVAELELLREFYSAWRFLHSVRNEPSDSEKWDRTRLEMSAQKLVEAAGAVERFRGAH